MGGWGSGRYGGRPTADASLRIDLAWMMRSGLASEGAIQSGALNWSRGGSPSGSISYVANMVEAGSERLELAYTRCDEEVRQIVRLQYSLPHYGGKRWWMTCPYRGNRVAKLYLPPGGDRFASRQAWRLGYQSQREASRDRPFTRLSRLQRKLGSNEGWEAGIYRPKGMWQSTFEHHLKRYYELEDACDLEMIRMMARLGGGPRPRQG